MFDEGDEGNDTIHVIYPIFPVEKCVHVFSLSPHFLTFSFVVMFRFSGNFLAV